jgi:hypothetical protein
MQDLLIGLAYVGILLLPIVFAAKHSKHLSDNDLED